MFFNSQAVCLLLLLGSFARADEPKCEEDCAADGWCKTMCYYQPQGDADGTDLIDTCTQLETGAAECEVETAPGNDLKTEGDCKKYADTKNYVAYRFFKLNLPDGADGVIVKYVCELLSACRSRGDITDEQAEQQDFVVGSGKTCDDPANTVMCPTFPFSAGNNIVRWICEDKELTNKNDPYYYKQAVGTVCNPTHDCHNPVITSTTMRAKCIEDPDNSETGKWVDDTDEAKDPAALEACNCPTLKIPAAQGTNLACTNKPEVDVNGDFTLGNGGASNECALFCDNYFIADLTCEFAKDSTADVKTTWVASWDGNRNEIKDCLSCWEGGCDKPPKI